MGSHFQTGALLSLFYRCAALFLAVLRYRLCRDFSGDRAYMRKLTMYGLSFTANLVCASATRRFASATRRDKSSDVAGVPGPEGAAADAVRLETDGEGVVTVGIAAAGFTGVGAASLGVIFCGPVPTPNEAFRIAASFAAISARFWAIRSVCACRGSQECA